MEETNHFGKCWIGTMSKIGFLTLTWCNWRKSKGKRTNSLTQHVRFSSGKRILDK